MRNRVLAECALMFVIVHIRHMGNGSQEDLWMKSFIEVSISAIAGSVVTVLTK